MWHRFAAGGERTVVKEVQTLSCPHCPYISLPSPSATHSLPFGLSPYFQWPPSHQHQHRLHCLPKMPRSDDQESAPAQSTANHNSKCIFNSTHVFIGPCMGTNYAFKNITGKCCKWLSLKKPIVISLKINKKKALVLSCQLGVGACLTLLSWEGQQWKAFLVWCFYSFLFCLVQKSCIINTVVLNKCLWTYYLSAFSI